METFTVYDHPIDFPDHFVVRRFTTSKESIEPIPDEDIFLKHKDIEWIRERLAHCGLVRIHRCADDDPKILETWI